MQGLKRHSHDERLAIAHRLVSLFQRKFGENLLAIALAASVARNGDRAYSDLELVIFLSDLPPDEASYLQRVNDGLLIEAVYTTESRYLEMWRTLGLNWWQGGSEPLAPLLNDTYVAALLAKRAAYEHTRAAYVNRAAHHFLDTQESFGKVLNAIDAGNRENVSLLHYAAVMPVLATLAFLNQTPLTTMATYITEARQFAIKPPHLDAFLDRLLAADPGDMNTLRQLYETLFAEMEALFAAEGYVLYDESIDPHRPNKNFLG